MSIFQSQCRPLLLTESRPYSFIQFLVFIPIAVSSRKKRNIWTLNQFITLKRCHQNTHFLLAVTKLKTRFSNNIWQLWTAEKLFPVWRCHGNLHCVQYTSTCCKHISAKSPSFSLMMSTRASQLENPCPFWEPLCKALNSNQHLCCCSDSIPDLWPACGGSLIDSSSGSWNTFSYVDFMTQCY